MSCDSRHVLVTGASTGIGRAAALRLARDGFHVFATVRRPQDAESLARAAGPSAAAPEPLTALLMDVTEASQITQVAQTIRSHTGTAGVDALVNNAGVGLAWPVELVPLDKLRWDFAINVEGQVAVTQALLPLIRQARGRIVMIGSVGGRITLPFAGPLASAKHALRSLADALRIELAPWGIAVVLIEPASIHTDAIDKLARDLKTAERDFGPRGWALYGQAFGAMAGKALARETAGSAPEAVAAVVSRAITARRPRARYLVGKDARRLATLAKLPPRARDVLLRKVLGQPPPGSMAGRASTGPAAPAARLARAGQR
jgi:NAD(P)-dependent dehydrogenase (short-subunit alcohol dehydrogenase family)